jgi:hypothetical protein
MFAGKREGALRPPLAAYASGCIYLMRRICAHGRFKRARPVSAHHPWRCRRLSFDTSYACRRRAAFLSVKALFSFWGEPAEGDRPLGLRESLCFAREKFALRRASGRKRAVKAICFHRPAGRETPCHYGKNFEWTANLAADMPSGRQRRSGWSVACPNTGCSRLILSGSGRRRVRYPP